MLNSGSRSSSDANADFPFRATLFGQIAPSSNWLVVWHQAYGGCRFAKKRETPNWGPVGSVGKGGRDICSTRPASALEQSGWPLRIHLDDFDQLETDPLRVLPQATHTPAEVLHRCGEVARNSIPQIRGQVALPTVDQGGSRCHAAADCSRVFESHNPETAATSASH